MILSLNLKGNRVQDPVKNLVQLHVDPKMAVIEQNQNMVKMQS